MIKRKVYLNFKQVKLTLISIFVKALHYHQLRKLHIKFDISYCKFFCLNCRQFADKVRIRLISGILRILQRLNSCLNITNVSTFFMPSFPVFIFFFKTKLVTISISIKIDKSTNIIKTDSSL